MGIVGCRAGSCRRDVLEMMGSVVINNSKLLLCMGGVRWCEVKNEKNVSEIVDLNEKCLRNI